MSSKNKIYLFTSDIAAFIGQNSYDFVTPFERLWKRCDSECYNKLINMSKTSLLENHLQCEKLNTDQKLLKDDLDKQIITKRQYTLRFNKLQRQIEELKVSGERLETQIDNIDLTQEQRLKKQLGDENVSLVKSDKVETDDKRKNITNIIKDLNISDEKNMAASVSSGTHRINGMIVAPCSMKTLAAIANGYDDTLVARSAGVTIKEDRKLILMVRETPLSAIHLENMLKLSRLGVIILPPVTEFYTKPKTIDDIVNHGVGKCLDQFDIDHDLYPRWGSF